MVATPPFGEIPALSAAATEENRFARDRLIAISGGWTEARSCGKTNTLANQQKSKNSIAHGIRRDVLLEKSFGRGKRQ